MVKVLSLILLMVSPCLADQIRTTYKRDKILWQYLFNEQTGTSFADTSTHAYTATFSGSGNSIINGKTGKAVSMSGSGGLLLSNPADGTDDNAIQDFTFIASVRPKSGQVATTCIVCKNDDIGNTVIIGFRNHYPYMNWAISGGVDPITDVQSPETVSSSTWHFIVYKRKAGGIKQIEVDGRIMANKPTIVSTYNSAGGSNGNFELMTNSAGANNNVVGDLDEATWYRTYLSDGETYQLYQEWLGRKKLQLR